MPIGAMGGGLRCVAASLSDMTTQGVASGERLVAIGTGQRGAPQMDGRDVLADVVVVHLHTTRGTSAGPLTDDARTPVPGMSIYVGLLQVV